MNQGVELPPVASPGITFLAIEPTSLEASPGQTIIQGNGTSRLFEVGGAGNVYGNLTLSDLTLEGGKSTPDTIGGGAALVDGGSILSVNNCVVTSNTALGSGDNRYSSGGGGAFFVEAGSILRITDSTISNDAANEVEGLSGDTYGAGQGGGAGYNAYGGAIFEQYDATLTIANSAIINNEAAGGAGGNASLYPAVFPDFGTAGENSPTAFGGAGGGVAYSGPDSYGGGGGGGVGFGGGIYAEGSVSLTNVTLAENQAVRGGGGYSQGFSGTPGAGVGGAIYTGDGSAVRRASLCST